MATKIIRSLSDFRNDSALVKNTVIAFLVGVLIGVISLWSR